MAELDVFEPRFAAAYRRYLDEVRTEVDAAAMARAAASARPRARWAAWRGTLRPVPALAWLVLVALVIAALATALFAASQREQRFPAVVPPVMPAFVCPPGSMPDEPGPVGYAPTYRDRPAGGPSAFDRESGRIVLLAGDDNGNETWTFDVCTNTWARMYPNQEPTGGTLVYDVDSDVTIASDGTRMWAYDLEANTWADKGYVPAADPGLALRFYDPISGLVMATEDDRGDALGPSSLWGYEVETNAWTPIPQANQVAIDLKEYVYDASVDRMVAYGLGDGGPETWLFDLRTGAWSRSGAVTPEFDYGWFAYLPAIAYDEAAERTVMNGSGRTAAYDATADRWETLLEAALPLHDGAPACDSRPECRGADQMVYDPVNERFVVYGRWSIGALDNVLALDTRTRQWMVLLEPGRRREP